MKKIYIEPVTTTVKLKVETLLNTPSQTDLKNVTTEETLDTKKPGVEGDGDGTDIDARSFTLWEDWE